MQNIKNNRRVAVAIYDSTARKDDIDGVQIEATASVLEGKTLVKEWNHIFKIKFAKRKKRYTIEMFQGASARRIGKITPKRFYKFDRTSTPGEDKRQQVFLK